MNFLIYVLYNCVQKMNSTDFVYAQTHILSITTQQIETGLFLMSDGGDDPQL